MSWELLDIDEAKQLKNQLVSYAEDKREFTQTQDELIMHQESIGKSIYLLIYQITNLPIKFFEFVLIQHL